jgi:sec-independent protein translocase protein TatA
MVAEGSPPEPGGTLRVVAFLGPIGTPELIIIMIVLLLLFGAKRLPEMGRSVGRGMREFKDAVTGEDKPASKPAELEPPDSGDELDAEDAEQRETVR